MSSVSALNGLSRQHKLNAACIATLRGRIAIFATSVFLGIRPEIGLSRIGTSFRLDSFYIIGTLYRLRSQLLEIRWQIIESYVDYMNYWVGNGHSVDLREHAETLKGFIQATRDMGLIIEKIRSKVNDPSFHIQWFYGNEPEFGTFRWPEDGDERVDDVTMLPRWVVIRLTQALSLGDDSSDSDMSDTSDTSNMSDSEMGSFL